MKDEIRFVTNDSLEQTKRVHYAMNIKEDFSKMSAKQLKNAPVSAISTENLDFGEMQKNTNKTLTFTVSNSGKSPLIIRGLETSNSMYKVSSNMMEIPAGGSAEISVYIKAPSRASTQNASIDIITNDPNNPIRTIQVKGRVL